MLMIVTPGRVGVGKHMREYRVRCIDQRGELDIQTIAKNQAGAMQIVRDWLDGRDWHPATPGTISGWGDCDGPDLGEPEAA